MRSILLAGFLFPLFAGAQDCKVVRETDPYTRETRLSSGFIALQTGASVSVDANKKEIDFFFIVPDKCFNDQSSVFIFFEGSKTKTTYRNAGSMNCDGNFHFTFKNGTVTPTVVKKLSTLKVSQFIFTGTDKKEMIVSLLPAQQEKLMQAVACLEAESKKL